MKKYLKWVILITLIILGVHIVLNFIFGSIDYKGTLSTKYIKNDSTQTIITKHFEIETPKNWIHIFQGYGSEATAGGMFLTKSGMIEYEYGPFSNPFEIDSIFVFSRDSLIAGRFVVYIGRNENNETGIYIPRQHEMELPFSFYMSKACTDNLNDILAGIKSMKFKQLYFFYPEIDKAILYFKNNWSEDEINSFKNKPEDEAVTELHSSVGRWIRNNWLSESQKSELVEFFHSEGIYNRDDMSSIILTSLHRNLNGEYIDLYGQIESCLEYWRPIWECEYEQKQLAIKNFERIKITDTIQIYMPVDTSDNDRNAVLYDCPTTEWNFNPQKDLLVVGKVIDKYHINDSSNVFIKVQILKMNHKNTSILMNEVKIGETIDLSLIGLKINL